MDAPPSGFAFPSEAEYATYLIRAASEAAPLVNASYDDLAPPVMAHVAMLGATLEEASGLPLSELVKVAGSIQQLASTADPALITAAVGDLIQGAFDIASVSLKTAAIAAEAAAAIPILGAFVDVVAGYLKAIYDSQQNYVQAQEDCQERYARIMQVSCQRGVNSARPTPTQSGGTPSDLFRPYAYVIQQQEGRIPKGAGGSVLPLTPASIYVVLCGDALPLPLFGGGYGRFRTPPAPYNKSMATGIPLVTRRRMWACIRSICAAVERPGIKYAPAPVGDAGRAMMIVLQELIRSAWLKGQLTDAHVRAASDLVTTSWKAGDYCQDLVSGEIAAGAVPYGFDTCKSFVDLADPFLSQILGFQNALFAAFFKGGKWTIGPQTALGVGPKLATGHLVLGPSSSSALSKSFQQIHNALGRTRPVRASTRIVAGASTATIAGAAAALIATLL